MDMDTELLFLGGGDRYKVNDETGMYVVNSLMLLERKLRLYK